MPKVPDVVAGETIESAWGNTVRDMTVQRMTNEADRDASFPSPSDGETVWIQDVDELRVWDGSAWTRYVNTTGDTFTGLITMRSTQAGVPTPIAFDRVDTTQRWRLVEAGDGNFKLEWSPDSTSSFVTVVTFVDSGAGGLFASRMMATYQCSALSSQIRNIQVFGSTPTGGVAGDLAVVNQGGSLGIWYNNAGTWIKIGTP